VFVKLDSYCRFLVPDEQGGIISLQATVHSNFFNSCTHTQPNTQVTSDAADYIGFANEMKGVFLLIFINPAPNPTGL
jgi:hypothetical protein